MDWKTRKMRKLFPVREKSGILKQTGKVGEFYQKYWKCCAVLCMMLVCNVSRIDTYVWCFTCRGCISRGTEDYLGGRRFYHVYRRRNPENPVWRFPLHSTQRQDLQVWDGKVQGSVFSSWVQSTLVRLIYCQNKAHILITRTPIFWSWSMIFHHNSKSPNIVYRECIYRHFPVLYSMLHGNVSKYLFQIKLHHKYSMSASLWNSECQ